MLIYSTQAGHSLTGGKSIGGRVPTSLPDNLLIIRELLNPVAHKHIYLHSHTVRVSV